MPDLTLDGLASAATADPAVPAARTLVDVFEQTAGAHPGRLALDAPDARLTYGELRAHAGELAGRLNAAGAGPGDRVAVRIPSGTAELYTAILAVLLAGAAYVPIDAEDPDERVERILTGSGASLALGAGGEITAYLPPLRGPVATGPAPHDDAWVIFTSGSTGEPKAVAVSHRSAAAFVDAESRLWTVRPEDRVLAGLSVGFDASCEEIWLAWAHGAALVPAPRALMRSGAELGPWLREHGVTVVSTVPSLAATWEETSLGGVRLLVLGGEACPESLAWRLSERREVWNTYGPTEATVVSTAARLTPGATVTIGTALAGWETAVLDEAGEPVGPGQPGELVIGGVGLGRYLDPELDAARYPALPALGWPRAYPTGDIVRETPEGLAFVGRRDDQVKLGGRRVELGEIEVALCGVPGVRAASATVRETESGNRVLVGYITGETQPAAVRRELAERLPAALVPLVVMLDALPLTTAGKVDRRALPWPPPLPTASAALGTETERWLAEQFAAQLGPLPLGPDSDFFALGGTSLAAAKLASALRQRFPAAAVADVYHHPGLGELAARLDEIGGAGSTRPAASAGNRARGEATRAAGMLGLFSLAAPPWIVVVLALDRLSGLPGPRIGWGWLIGIWLLVASPVGQALLVGGVRRLLMRGVRPGRYPRHGSVACRVWFLERLGESTRLASLAGTPWAVRYARLSGHAVGDGARLGTLPSASGLCRIGAGATLEGDVDLHGWWLDGPELVIDETEIGPGARIGTRAMLMPGARIGAGAEIEPGSVVDAVVGAGERWSGAPARRVGLAGERWPLLDAPPVAASARVNRLRYGAGLTFASVLPGLAALPGIVLLVAFARERTVGPLLVRLLELAPAAAVSFVALDALLAALAVRALRGRIRPGWHGEGSMTGWALWLTETLLAGTRGALFPLYSSLFTRPWLRLAGIPVAPRAEISTGIGLSRLTTLADGAFVADDVVFAVSRSRDAWLHVAPITVGEGSFLGNGAMLEGGTSLGAGSLVGLLTTAPVDGGEHTSWLGSPPIELPRRALATDPRRTLHPPRRLIAGRLAVELVRILLPASLSAVLGMLVYVGLTATGADLGLLGLVALAPLSLIAAGVAAMVLTAVIKWTAIGRYRPGDHPLWSSFVWRDEIVNSAQEQLAGTWLLGNALGTPVMSAYLRLMGARVGRDVHCETLTITEFDVTRLDDGAVVNRSSVVETHLFHDRIMQIGSVRIGAGATLGPSSAVLPDATLGDGCSVGGRSIVMRGETLPPDTRWHGAPVTAVR